MATSDLPSRCGWCHSPSDSCPRILWCGEGGAADHRAPAVFAVDYVIDRSGRGDYDHGDVEHLTLHTCSHPSCIASAEDHAATVGQLGDTRELTAEDISEATGYELAGV